MERPIEQENDELHRRIAALIRRDPSLIEKARARLNEHIARNPLPAREEWRTALRHLDAADVVRFIESTTPRARRMKISSPFFFLLREAS
jgi:hypothetical protein